MGGHRCLLPGNQRGAVWYDGTRVLAHGNVSLRSHDLSVVTPGYRTLVTYRAAADRPCTSGIAYRGPVAIRETVGTDVREPRSCVKPVHGQAGERTTPSLMHDADRHPGTNQQPV